MSKVLPFCFRSVPFQLIVSPKAVPQGIFTGTYHHEHI